MNTKLKLCAQSYVFRTVNKYRVTIVLFKSAAARNPTPIKAI